jgi:hypothetical protein
MTISCTSSSTPSGSRSHSSSLRWKWMEAIVGCKILNTALDHQEEEKVEGFEYTAQARSMVIFKGKQQWTEEKNKK